MRVQVHGIHRILGHAKWIAWNRGSDLISEAKLLLALNCSRQHPNKLEAHVRETPINCLHAMNAIATISARLDQILKWTRSRTSQPIRTFKNPLM